MLMMAGSVSKILSEEKGRRTGKTGREASQEEGLRGVSDHGGPELGVEDVSQGREDAEQDEKKDVQDYDR